MLIHQSTFNGVSYTTVAAITPAVGTNLSSWFGGNVYAHDGRAYLAGIATGGMSCSEVPGSANYSASIVVSNRGSIANPGARLFLRYVDANNHVIADVGLSGITLIKRVAGVNTTLGTYTRSLSGTTAERTTLWCSGAGVHVAVDGTERIAASLGGDLSGVGGTRWSLYGDTNGSQTTGMQLDVFEIDDAVPAPTIATRRRCVVTSRRRAPHVARRSRVWGGPPCITLALPADYWLPRNPAYVVKQTPDPQFTIRHF